MWNGGKKQEKKDNNLEEEMAVVEGRGVKPTIPVKW